MFLAFWSANWRKGVPALRAPLPRVARSPVLRLAVSVGPVEYERSNGWAFITPWNIGICLDMLHPVDRWNECGG
jgi:hypothetical protein